jgi:hypothetical protein
MNDRRIYMDVYNIMWEKLFCIAHVNCSQSRYKHILGILHVSEKTYLIEGITRSRVR